MTRLIETQVQDCIVSCLTQVGVWAFRVRAEASFRGRPAVPKGTPDIWTEFGWIEVKMRTGILSPEQTAWHDMAHRHHVRACIVYEGPEGPHELVTHAVKTVLRWRAETRRRACPHERCPLEDP
jgi:hypothetical protein